MIERETVDIWEAGLNPTNPLGGHAKHWETYSWQEEAGQRT